MTNPDAELLDTIEKIRQHTAPELPADLVRQIVLVERDYQDNRHEANKRITALLDEYLSKPGVISPSKG